MIEQANQLVVKKCYQINKKLCFCRNEKRIRKKKDIQLTNYRPFVIFFSQVIVANGKFKNILKLLNFAICLKSLKLEISNIIVHVLFYIFYIFLRC